MPIYLFFYFIIEMLLKVESDILIVIKYDKVKNTKK